MEFFHLRWTNKICRTDPADVREGLSEAYQPTLSGLRPRRWGVQVPVSAQPFPLRAMSSRSRCLASRRLASADGLAIRKRAFGRRTHPRRLILIARNGSPGSLTPKAASALPPRNTSPWRGDTGPKQLSDWPASLSYPRCRSNRPRRCRRPWGVRSGHTPPRARVDHRGGRRRSLLQGRVRQGVAGPGRLGLRSRSITARSGSTRSTASASSPARTRT